MYHNERRATALLLAAVVLLASCRQQMADQPSYRTYDPSSFFPDGQSARPLQPGVVPHDVAAGDLAFTTGKNPDGTDVTAFPQPVTPAMLARGQERFNIFCAPCHDRLGEGRGMVVQRGFMPPPSFHTDRLRTAPVGHFFDVMTKGFGAMPTYAPQISVPDRWAIVAYIRALQLSQRAPLTAVPPEERARLGTETPQP